ncbi:hypothetical protein IW142_004564 [Coemansia sp. RSA 564]|nr:hypothetical protein IW142_004564 [Coemansia sp. RSA 564]
MATSVFDTHSARQSVGSTGSGSRRHSLLSTDGRAGIQYDYANAWGARGDKLSRWRRAYLASDTGDSSGVQSTSLALPDESRFTTCMAMSEDQSLLAAGSGSYDTNMFFVQSLDDQLDVKASFASKFPIYSLAFKGDLLMAGTDRNTSVLYKVDRARLLGYAVENSIDAAQGVDGPLVRCVGTYKNKAAKSIDIAAPGSHIPTKRVACVEFAPAFASGSGWPPSSVAPNSELFLSALGGVVNIWDATRNQQALRVEKVSAQPVCRATWSAQAPATLVAAAGFDGVISILDLRRRGKAVAWRTAQPEAAFGAWLGGDGYSSAGACINDVAWSPFVPYWLATGGEGGSVRVWDLRYAAADGAAVATLRHPTNHGAIRSLAWSATHADLLSTGTSDKSWWLHSLRADDVASGALPSVQAAVIADKRSADDIGSVVALHAKGSSFYTLSSCGDLYAHRVTPSALAGATASRITGDDIQGASESTGDMQGETVLERDMKSVEAAVSARDLKGAAEVVLNVVQRLRADSAGDSDEHPILRHADSIKRLCDLFKAKPRIKHTSWALPPAAVALSSGLLADSTSIAVESEPVTASDASPSAALKDFASDLAYVAYGLPPDFPLESTASRQPVVWQALEQLNMANLRIRLGRLVETADRAGDTGSVPTDADGRPLWKSIVDRERQIMQYAKAEPALFDARLLRAVVKLVLPHDCIAGLTLGLGICQAYLSNQRLHEQRGDAESESVSCTMLDALVHVLLFPTVFDTDTSAGSAADSSDSAMAARPVLVPNVQMVRERISECLAACPEAVFEMVRLEISIQETVLKGGEQKAVAEDIVRIVQRHAKSVRVLLENTGEPEQRMHIQIHAQYPATTTLSASAVRLYLNSLLSTRGYDEHLVNSQWWRVAPAAVPADAGHVIGSDIGWLSSFPLARMLNRQTASAIVPRMQRQIDVVLATIKKEPLGLEPRLYRDTLLKVARVTLLMRSDQHLSFVVDVASKNKETGETLTTRQTVSTAIDSSVLADAFDSIGSAFLMLLEALTRHSSHRDAFKRAASEALPLYESLSQLLESQRNVRDPTDMLKSRMMAVRKYLRKLEHYANGQQPSGQQ